MMQPIKLTLDPGTIAAGRDLAARYGCAASLSAVTRRAIALLAEHWEAISSSEELKSERGAMMTHLSKAERGSSDRARVHGGG